MAAERVFEVYSDPQHARWAVWGLACLGALFTVFWLFLSWHNPALLWEVLLILAGPVCLAGAIWGLLRHPPAKLRLRIAGDVMTVWPARPRGVSHVMAIADLSRISLIGHGRMRLIQFDTADRSVRLAATGLAVRRAEILRRITLVIEAQGKRVEEDISPVAGFHTGRFVVVDGAAF